ncbi:hypothetical protein E2C01_030951 [Portunus trituberculatus]|uniref:Uncharacterized protein n=1 Tax=Portunus trituberculatus TaxID=210409 RepID=A0A5B7ERS3_PORTR|nr:hypothetical protein [Portunus trituberculatus]
MFRSSSRGNTSEVTLMHRRSREGKREGQGGLVLGRREQTLRNVSMAVGNGKSNYGLLDTSPGTAGDRGGKEERG